MPKHILDLAPTPSNRRNSEGAFITLNNGDILFIYTRYNDGDDDGAAADLYGVRSTDGGETFGAPQLIFPHSRIGADNVMSVSLLRMKNGDIGLFFLVKTKPSQCHLWLSRSSDEGGSWSDPICCIGQPGYYVVNNDRVVRLDSGRLIFPASFLKIKDEASMNGYMPSIAYFYVSDDDGGSWNLTGSCEPSFIAHSDTGLEEPGLIQLPNGILWAYFRTDMGRQYEAFSMDEGRRWTTVQPSAFTSAVSPMSVKRLSDGRYLAVWNPVPVYNGRSQFAGGFWTGGRTPLAVATSKDGLHFNAPTAIETDENSGYAYTAIHECADGSVLLAYCAGGRDAGDGMMLNRLRITKLSKEELSGI
ncbi:MAG: exo-alpha-sialidase [Clostridia bacterium]|nr:exo-alpha-sialidase [Clostridia bacterium]